MQVVIMLIFLKNIYKDIVKIKTKNIAMKSYITDFLQYLINQNVKIKAVKTKGGWIEIDTFSDLLAAKKSEGLG